MLNMKGVCCAHGAGSVISINFSGNAHSGWKVIDKYDKKNRTKMRALQDTSGDNLVLRHSRTDANRNLTFR